jgi:antitoxin component HigA of HigAB toxin-antitoxin module
VSPHWQPKDRKQDIANDIRDWARVLLHDPAAELTTLERLSISDLTALAIALDTAGEKWMSAVVSEAMPEPVEKKYPNGLRKAMEKAGKGPTELADRLDTNKQNITRWSNGDRKLTVEWAKRLAPLLETTADVLLLVERDKDA